MLIVEDPDAPNGTFPHWMLYDMSPATLAIIETQGPLTGKKGMNDAGGVGCTGPCPPSGTHRYFFKLFALDTMLNLPEGSPKQTLLQAMDGHVIESAELKGSYTKKA